MAVCGLPWLIVAVGAALLLLPTPGAAQDAGWRDAVDRLAQEKALAEGCASILKGFAHGNPMTRVQGQRLYARAKADVDGLIALLEVDLAGARSPAAIPELRHRLEAVPRQRQALCRHVDAAVGMAVREQPGRTRVAELLTKGGGDALSSLIDAAVGIWRDYRHADHATREAITLELKGTRWRDYAEVPQT